VLHHLSALLVAVLRAGEADARPFLENDRVEEAEERVDAAVVQEAEAADLISFGHVVEGVDRMDRWHPEHSDLLIQIAQLRDLGDLLAVRDGPFPARPEEAQLGRRLVAAVAVEDEARDEGEPS